MSRSIKALLWGAVAGVSLSVPAWADVMESAPGDAVSATPVPLPPEAAPASNLLPLKNRKHSRFRRPTAN